MKFGFIHSFSPAREGIFQTIALCCTLGAFAASCDQTGPSNFSAVESAGVERVTFDARKSFVSSHDGQTYILTTTNEFNDLGFRTTRDASSVSDRTFSHIRFAAIRVYGHCQLARDAANEFNKSVNGRDGGWTAPYRHASKGIVLAKFYDRQESIGGVLGQEDITAYADPSYSHENTLREVDKCYEDMERVGFIDRASNKPSFVFWLRVADDSSSEHLNDVYVTRVTYNGIMSINLAEIIVQRAAEDIVIGAVGDVASGALAAATR